MGRRISAVVLACLWVLGLTSGCSSPSYNADIAQACSNGHLDPGESDVDCGGSCVPCAIGKSCQIDSECTTGTCLGAGTCNTSGLACRSKADCTGKEDTACVGLHCFDSTCRDGQLNNVETDVDCGGGQCLACGESKHCLLETDCAGGNACLEGICYNATCHNAKKDGHESDVDCGGDQCPPCVSGKACTKDLDCGDGYACLDNLCYSATCRDAKQDGTETAVDCGGSGCPACQAGANCLQNSDCATGTTCINQLCYVGSCSDGKLNNTETDVDCGGVQCPVCDKGKTCALASDCVAGVPCTNNKCGDPQCFDKQIDGTETAVDCGGTCAGCGLGSACNVATDCASLNCDNALCAPPNCHDKSKNGGESDVDCGDATGICPRCIAGAACTANLSCQSNNCVGGVCAIANCVDKIVNGTETDTDCGGSCKPCADGSACITSTDCQSKVCKGGKCQVPNCSDGFANGQETDKDCGGPCLLITPPQKCANGQGCASNNDCIQNTCTALLCVLPLCSNKTQDPGETDVDCGGSCAPCAEGQKCTLAKDCQSKVCNANGTCDPASCFDAVQNGNETDINCGGVTCTQRCLTGASCLSDSDCQSKVCDTKNNTCSAPSCGDTVQNGTETGPDCGGVCALMSPAKLCAAGLPCNVDDDCSSNNCCTASTCKSPNICEAPNCQDGKKNQGETGKDCGGQPPELSGTGCTARCGTGEGCNDATDCLSNVCTSGVCKPPTCTDGVKNGSEAGKDCGSSCPNACPAGTPCKGPGDCDSKNCLKDSSGNYTTCAAPGCNDGIQNGTETAKDCGGGDCPGCGLGKNCVLARDCDLTLSPTPDCVKNVCQQQPCHDTVFDPATETDTDCGNACPKCANGQKCGVAADCVSARCADDGTGTLRCAIPTCSDGVPNQGESGVDCGGTSPCAKCGTGFGCTQPIDCINGVCGANNTCSAPTCADGVQNQGETDRDCGGPNCRASNACANDLICSVNIDCKENWCTADKVCKSPSCTDNIQNGLESDLDCGGNCTVGCADGKICNKDSDCANKWCNGLNKCATPACGDGFKNGTETGLDCGGNCALSCAKKLDSSCRQCGVNAGCGNNIDCLSFNCAGDVCAAPTNCVAKELNGQGPAGCALCANLNSSDVPICKAYLVCYILNGCNPVTHKDLNGANCDQFGSEVCGVNTIGGGLAPQTAAVNSYKCACP